MNLYQRNDRGGVRRLIVATIVLVVVFAIDAGGGGWIRAHLRAVSVSVWKSGSRVASLVSGSEFFSSRRALLQENEALREEIAELQVRAATTRVLKEEVASLRAITRLAEAEPGLAAPIVSSLASSPYGTFMLGAGTEDGVVPGNLVIAGDAESGGIVLGRVSEARAHLSLATQIFAPNVRSDATIRGALVTVEGQGGGNARAKAPRAIPIATGDPVISSDFRGRTIGIVGAVRMDSASAYQDVYIRLPISLLALQFVYVVPISQ